MNKLTSCTMTELPFWKSATKSYLNCHKFVLSHWSRSLESNDYDHHGEVECVLHKQLVRVRRLFFDNSILFGRLTFFQFPHIRAFELRPSICRSTTRLLKEEYPYQFVSRCRNGCGAIHLEVWVDRNILNGVCFLLSLPKDATNDEPTTLLNK